MMKHVRKRVLRFLAINILILFFIPSYAQEDIVIDKIIAKVDDYIILKSDLEKSYLEYLSRGEFNQGNMRCQILENLVVNKMLVAKAEIDSVIVSDAEVQSNLRRRMDYMVSQIGSEEEIEKFYGKSLRQIEVELFDDIKEQLTVQTMQQEIIADLKVTPSEVRKFYNNIPQDSLPFFSTEVVVGQIVKKPEAGAKQREKVIRQLHELRGRILKGENFATLARVYSEDPGSASRGGELPFFKRGELAPEYEATALTLEKGELSNPVRTEFGYHIIELIEKRGNTFKSRHILIKPEPSENDIQNAYKYLDSLRSVILNDSLPFQQAAKDLSDDKMTSGNGGFFTAEDGANRVSVEEIDPNIFFTIDTMDIGEITKPIAFVQADGTKAFRIIYYKDKVPPHEANLRDDYQKIANAALNEKQARILSSWFKEARNEVFIQVDPEYDYCNLTQ